MSGRDHFAMAFTRREMEQHLSDLVQMAELDFRKKYTAGNKTLDDVRDWHLGDARQKYIVDPESTPVVPILYRPFDSRWHGFGRVTSSVPGLINRAFLDQSDNTAIILSPDSHAVGGEMWSNAWATKCVTNLDIFRRSGAYLFPKRLADGTPGIRPEVLDALSAAYGRSVGLDEAFGYLYGLFWTPAYRAEFQADLLDGYPPVVFPSEGEVFSEISRIGQMLLDLHTLSASGLSDGRDVVDFPAQVSGDVVVEKPHYDAGARRYYLNPAVYAEAIEPEVMAFSVGGYPSVLHEYVAARVGRVWNEEEYAAWVKSIDSIRQTFARQRELDPLYDRLQRSVLALESNIFNRPVEKKMTAEKMF